MIVLLHNTQNPPFTWTEPWLLKSILVSNSWTLSPAWNWTRSSSGGLWSSSNKENEEKPYINSSCTILSFLNGMFFCPLLGGILCPAHHCLVPYSDLPKHLKMHVAVLKCSSLMLQEVQGHVHYSFNIPLMQNMASMTKCISTLWLSTPIVGLPLPDLCMQCPNCEGWFISRDRYPPQCMMNHWQQSPTCSIWYQSQLAPLDP